MVIFVFNIIIILLSLYILYDFKNGFILFLCSVFAIPDMVRLSFGVYSINYIDFIFLILISSFFINRIYKNGTVFPLFRKLLQLQLISTFILILLSYSSEHVPFSYQISYFIKNYILHEYAFLLLGFYACSIGISRMAIIFLFSVVCICCVYGVFCYYIGTNIYTNALYLLYIGTSNIYETFSEEIRGSLTGRTSGTMNHPLSWGQACVIIMSFYFLIRSKLNINNVLGITLVSLCFINVFLSGSRSALIYSLIILIPNLYVIFKGKIKVFIFIIFAFMILIPTIETSRLEGVSDYMKASFFFWDQSYSDKIGIGGSSVTMRNNQLELSLSIALNNIFGIGYGFHDYMINHSNKWGNDLYGLESIVFIKCVEQGFIGLFVFIYIYFKIYKYFIPSVYWLKNHLALFSYIVGYLFCILLTGIQGFSWILFLIFLLIYKSVLYNDSKNNTLLLAKR